MKRFLLLALPSLLGVLVLWRWHEGTLIYYVASRYLWLVAGGAVFLFCLGFLGLFFGHAVSHVQKSVRPWQICFLAMPVGLGFGVSPQPLSAYTAVQRGLGQTLPAFLTPEPFSFAVDSSQRRFGDWARILYSSADKKDLVGQKADISGFISQKDGDFYLTRFQVSCCAADGRPFGILLAPKEPLEVNSWWRVTGEMRLNAVGDIFLEEEMSEEIDIPENPYL